jgi:hypothetical protein
MHVPSEDELAAIAVAYLSLQRVQTPPAPPVSRWRLAARALAPNEPQRERWRQR